MLHSRGTPETQDRLKWGSQSVSVSCLGTFEAHRSLRCTSEELQHEKAAKEAGHESEREKERTNGRA